MIPEGRAPSTATRSIRDRDIASFRAILDGCGISIPRDLQPHLPTVLWFFQMGIIFFWVTDESPEQARTRRLLDLGAKLAAALVHASAFPLMRPLRKTVLELIAIIEGDEQ